MIFRLVYLEAWTKEETEDDDIGLGIMRAAVD